MASEKTPPSLCRTEIFQNPSSAAQQALLGLFYALNAPQLRPNGPKKSFSKFSESGVGANRYRAARRGVGGWEKSIGQGLHHGFPRPNGWQCDRAGVLRAPNVRCSRPKCAERALIGRKFSSFGCSQAFAHEHRGIESRVLPHFRPTSHRNQLHPDHQPRPTSQAKQYMMEHSEPSKASCSKFALAARGRGWISGFQSSSRPSRSSRNRQSRASRASRHAENTANSRIGS